MASKVVLVFCVQALFLKSTFSMCIGSPLAYDGFGPNPGCIAPFVPAASTGGSFIVTSSSPIAPTGVSIISENVFEGTLIVGGDLPMLGSVGVEGELCTAGAGAVSYGCGDDVTAIVAEEGPITTGIVPVIAVPSYALAGYNGFAPFGYGIGYGYDLGYGLGGFGYGPGFGFGYGNGCGCAVF